MSGRKRIRPADFALSNPLRPSAARRLDVSSSLYASGLSAQTALKAHHSCVNALAVSPGEGTWLASGGDDQRVLLWDAHDSTDEGTGLANEPRGSYTGAMSNIFAIAFSADARRIFSAGNDAAIIMHDLETSASSEPPKLWQGKQPDNAWLDHDDAVMGLSAHPSNPALFISASSDGTLRHFDTRTSPGCVGLLADRYGMNSVVHHPLTPDCFVYAGEDGHLALLDGRMAWGGETQKKLAYSSAVQRYSSPTISSACISPSGSLICATLSGYLPTLYELSDPTPLASFHSPDPSAPAPPPLTTLPPRPSKGQVRPLANGYRDTTTTKHGSFGGGPGATAGDGLYYAAGSDDHRAYVWEVPSVEKLKAQREMDWSVSSFKASERDVVFQHGTWSLISRATSYDAPALISPASSILTGHRSIVNTALFHPTLPLLYTSGIEKLIIRHAPPRPSAPFPFTSAERKWLFFPRARDAPTEPASLTGPADPALDPLPLPGESRGERELRLREEDAGVLRYFDALAGGWEGEGALWSDDERGGALSDEEEDEWETEESDEDGNEGAVQEMIARAAAAQAEVPGLPMELLPRLRRAEDGRDGSTGEEGEGADALAGAEDDDM
ncbi:hypothetical protein Rhopal_007597-T1 [Rhodotorula paludigena]|uniref:WD40 repeat-like protein n=1 Tax=Rhodotorula paludigena TaxID=86838 RepID=A0AAV5GX28_9BASI|nr:hypothetical protein Rhopal_007597-T1 [Rhodotorula paludigena]